MLIKWDAKDTRNLLIKHQQVFKSVVLRLVHSLNKKNMLPYYITSISTFFSHKDFLYKMFSFIFLLMGHYTLRAPTFRNLNQRKTLHYQNGGEGPPQLHQLPADLRKGPGSQIKFLPL